MLAAGVQELAAAVETIDLPDPRPLAGDEVLIEVRSAGVANWDELVSTGEWDVGRAPPMALGVAAAGVIAAVGEAVGKWKEGDEVLTHPLPLRDQGTWAPSLIAPGGAAGEKTGRSLVGRRGGVPGPGAHRRAGDRRGLGHTR